MGGSSEGMRPLSCDKGNLKGSQPSWGFPGVLQMTLVYVTQKIERSIFPVQRGWAKVIAEVIVVETWLIKAWPNPGCFQKGFLSG